MGDNRENDCTNFYTLLTKKERPSILTKMLRRHKVRSTWQADEKIMNLKETTKLSKTSGNLPVTDALVGTDALGGKKLWKDGFWKRSWKFRNAAFQRYFASDVLCENVCWMKRCLCLDWLLDCRHVGWDEIEMHITQEITRPLNPHFMFLFPCSSPLSCTYLCCKIPCVGVFWNISRSIFLTSKLVLVEVAKKVLVYC